jgi:hypothetical protein
MLVLMVLHWVKVARKLPWHYAIPPNRWAGQDLLPLEEYEDKHHKMHKK